MPSLKKGSKKKKAEEEKQAAAAKAKEEKQAAAAKAAEAKEEVRPPYTNNPKVPRALGSPALRPCHLASRSCDKTLTMYRG